MLGSAKASGKRSLPGGMARRLLAFAGAGCAVAGTLSLWAVVDDPGEIDDPPLWIFVGLTIGSVALALLAVRRSTPKRWALLALIGSGLSLVAFWTLVMLFAG